MPLRVSAFSAAYYPPRRISLPWRAFRVPITVTPDIAADGVPCCDLPHFPFIAV